MSRICHSSSAYKLTARSSKIESLSTPPPIPAILATFSFNLQCSFVPTKIFNLCATPFFLWSVVKSSPFYLNNSFALVEPSTSRLQCVAATSAALGFLAQELFMVMEGVEEVNRAAVESCKKLVAVLSRSGDPFQPMPVARETDEAVARFGMVVAVLSDRLGHARARVGKRSAPAPVDASCLMDHPSMAPFQAPNRGLFVSTPAPPPPPPTTTTLRSVALMSSRQETEVVPAVVVAPRASVTLATPANKLERNMFLETPLLDLNSYSGVPSTNAMAVHKNTSKVVVAPVANPCTTTTATTHIQFQPQPQSKAQKSFLFDQTPSAEQFHIEVPVPATRGGGGSAKELISFSFDNNSVCTSSAATSFFTSISSQLISMSDAATGSAATATGKKACGSKRADDGGVKCHCPKKKKPRDKRVVRVPAISDKNADIPADNYSWRKYGQKPIKGSPHPRGYYRCSSKKDCPARKHVERCRSDPAMLIVTYENDHNHAQPLDPSVLAGNAEACS